MLTERAAIDFHQSGDQPIQSDDPWYLTDFLNSRDNIDASLNQSIESTDHCHEYRGPGKQNPQTIHMASDNPETALPSTENGGYHDAEPDLGPPEDLSLFLSQIMVKLTKIHHKLTGDERRPSPPPPGRRTTRLPISDECFKSQLQANIQAAEQILETLGRINDDQSRRVISDMEGHLPQKSFGTFEKRRSLKAPVSTHRQRDTTPFPSPYSSVGDDQISLDSLPDDSQNSITAMLVISIYLRLLHNFDILVSIMYTRIRECESNTRYSETTTSNLEVPTNKTEPFSSPVLHVSMGSCSFSSASATSLQVLFNVQLIDTFSQK
ncbi:uncharacterized protein N7483_010725 [Penicillium malachiteum]|uniref:uncharacterized protein n=1 Tax=Penicillium malachiteum TaxID=1324776 RepID=UPI002548EC8E|nr:uncharacterized protein N7483_010725 [Penicillium malachiteum]KAJ5713544.1 hypothetical protein N7483_010725 [Penicillium malachiteum]